MKVAIIGSAPSSRDLAPYHSPDVQIWTCSPGNVGVIPRVDAWFELHAVVDLGSVAWREWVEPYRAFLNRLSCPVYMQEKNDLVPAAIPFPHKEMVEKFGRGFYTSSVAWMLAFAIDKGATEISLFGVDMSASTEYDYERPGCQYFIEIARKAGIKVYIPPQSDLDVPTPLYGFGDALPMVTRLKSHCDEMRRRIEGIDRRQAELEADKLHMIKEKAHLEGAIEENLYIRKTWHAWSGPDRL